MFHCTVLEKMLSSPRDKTDVLEPLVGGDNGFSLVEILVVVGIVGILAAMTFPVLQNTREQGARAACLGNLAAVSRGLLHYTLDQNGLFPYTFESNAVTGVRSHWSEGVFKGGYTTSAESFLCPSMKYDPSVANQSLRSRSAMIRGLKFSETSPNANNATWAYISYGANRYGLMPYASDASWKRASLPAINNQAKILMLIESEDRPSFYGWFSVAAGVVAALPATATNTSPIAARHVGVANASFVDGHVESINVLKDLLPRSSNETNEPWFARRYTK